jgi:hypothetical protein
MAADLAIKEPCRVATTGNIATLSGLLTVDGVTVAASDRILVRAQTTATQNGIYVAASGAWTRATDFDGAGEVTGGTGVFVTSGDSFADSAWHVAGNGAVTPGSSAIAFDPEFLRDGTGAVPRTAALKLAEIEVNVNDFGAVPNDPGAAADNFVAIRNALAYVLAEETIPVRERKKVLAFGEGEYFIAGNSPLMFNRTEMTALPGGYRYRSGVHFRGRGRSNTILTLVPTEDEGDRWFYSTEDANYPENSETDHDTSVADQLCFEGITFRGIVTTAKQASGSQTNGFYWRSYGWEKFGNFIDCRFENLDRFMDVEGYGNVDHHSFFGCSWWMIRDRFMRMNNNQSLGWGFYGCHAEGICGRLFDVGPNGGGAVLWSGGSFVLYPELDENGDALVSQTQKAIVYWDNSGVTAGPSSGPANGKFIFDEIRLENYTASQAFVFAGRDDSSGYGQIEVTFRDCALPMAFATMAGSTDLTDTIGVYLENNAVVRFVRCSLHHAYSYECAKSEPNIRFEDCQFLNEVPITNTEGLGGRCSITGGGGTIQARGTLMQNNVINGDYSKMIVPDFNKGFYHLKDPIFSGQGKDPLVGWPQNGGSGPIQVYMAEGTLVLGFVICKPAEDTPLGSPITDWKWNLSDPTPVQIGDMTPDHSQNDEILHQQTFATPYRVPAAPDNYIQLNAQGSSVTELCAVKTGQFLLKLA